jgi:hypothetical protein
VNPVLLKIYGDRTCQLTAENSTLGMDQLTIMLNNAVTVQTANVPKDEKGVAISGTTATISGTPVVSQNVTVYLSNANKENIQKLTKVASAPTAGQFSITGSTITVASGTTGVLNIYYFQSVEAEVLSAGSAVAPVYKCYAKCLLQSISNKRLYAGDILCSNVQITPSVTLGGSNAAETPSSSSLVLDLLSINGVAPYTIIAHEIASESDL